MVKYTIKYQCELPENTTINEIAIHDPSLKITSRSDGFEGKEYLMRWLADTIETELDSKNSELERMFKTRAHDKDIVKKFRDKLPNSVKNNSFFAFLYDDQNLICFTTLIEE